MSLVMVAVGVLPVVPLPITRGMGLPKWDEMSLLEEVEVIGKENETSGSLPNLAI